jgi:type I restriction enzyme S subunit
MSDDGLPEGWASSHLSELVAPDAPIQYGILQPGPDIPGGVPYVRPTEIRADQIQVGELRRTSEEIAKQYRRSSLRGGDVLLTIVGSIGKVAVVPTALDGANITQSSARLRPRDGLVESRCLAWMLRSPLGGKQFEEATLGTGVQRLNIGDIRTMAMPLPPLPEQHRIVEKVEALLAEVNASRDRLARVLPILKRFRQAILAAACSGRLTEDWRDADEVPGSGHGLLDDLRRRSGGDALGTSHDAEGVDVPASWGIGLVRQVTTLVTSGSRGWAEFYSEEGPIFIRAQDINTDKLILEGVAHVRLPKKPEGTRTRVQRADMLVTITGANVTKTALLDREIGEAYVSQHVALVRPADARIGPWLHLWTISPAHGRKHLTDEAYGAGKPGLNLDNIRDMVVALPPLPEQAEIVRRVEALFALADAIEARVRAATARADKLPQAILSKAFKGELVPTEAELALAEGRTYETAAEMLARVKAAQDKEPTGKKPRGRAAKGKTA